MNEAMHAWPPRLPSLQRPRPAAASMPNCVLLAALLHLWLVLVLGNAPGGTAAPGQGVWGAINVRLRGPATDPPPLEPQHQAQPGGAAGQAATERWGGAVRTPAPLPADEPGAARLGTWGPAPAAGTAAAPALPVTQPLSAAAELPLPTATLQDLPAAGAPPAGPEPAPAETSLRTRLPAAGPAIAPLPLPSPLPAREATGLATVPLPAALPAPPAPPQRQLVSPWVQSAPSLPAAAPAIEPAPAAASLPALDPLPPQAVQAAPLRALKSVPAVPTERAVPLPRSADEAGSLPLPEIVAPQPMPALRPPTSESAARLPEPPTAMPPIPGPASAVPPTKAAPAAAADAGAQVGHDIATPASNAASAVPRLNLELSRPRGGELSRGSSRGVLPVLPRPPELDDKLARDIEKAAKIDCRKAYAGAGLLAAVPLAADALGKAGGCKW